MHQEFSDNFGINLQLLKKWEAEEAFPDEIAKLYLTVIAHSPYPIMMGLLAKE